MFTNNKRIIEKHICNKFNCNSIFLLSSIFHQDLHCKRSHYLHCSVTDSFCARNAHLLGRTFLVIQTALIEFFIKKKFPKEDVRIAWKLQSYRSSTSHCEDQFWNDNQLINDTMFFLWFSSCSLHEIRWYDRLEHFHPSHTSLGDNITISNLHSYQGSSD